MITKTKQFNEAFLKDLNNIVVDDQTYSREYDKNIYSLNNIKKGFQPFSKVKFTGSYLKTDFDQPFSDIDFWELIKKNKNIPEKIQKIVLNLDSTNFIFLQIECGSIEKLEIPWKITETGYCSFDIEKYEEWKSNIYLFPEDVHNFIAEKIKDDVFSLKDLIEISEVADIYTRISWKREDIIRGYKIVFDKKYDFVDCFFSLKRYLVMEYLYRYKNQYCLVDMGLRFENHEFPDVEVFKYKILKDDYNTLKNLKRFVDFNSNYTDLFQNIVKDYKLVVNKSELLKQMKSSGKVDEKYIQDFEKDVLKIMQEKQISSLEDIKKIYQEKSKNFIEESKKFVDKKYIKQFNIYEMRILEVENKIPLEILKNRKERGMKCPFFQLDSKTISFFYDKSQDARINCVKLLKCFLHGCSMVGADAYEFTDLFQKNGMYIQKKGDDYILIKDKQEIERSKDKNKFTSLVLFGK